LYLLLLLSGSVARGGIYSPHEPCYFEEFDAEGNAAPLGYSNFKLVLSEILRNDRREGLPDTENRKKLLDRVASLKAKGIKDLSSTDLATLSADLIRLGGDHRDEALNLLQPRTRPPFRGDFFVLSHLAQIHHDRQEWDAAFAQQSASLTDAAFPKTLSDFNPQQLTWLKRVESKFNLSLLRSRKLESSQKKTTTVHEEIDTIFPIRVAGKEWSPIRYQDETGGYRPGSIAPDETAKLPPDALAVMQQLVFWNPHDARLYWQLGEVYNARGEGKIALELMDECVNTPRSYSNRILMEHRAILRAQEEEKARIETDRRDADKRSANNRLGLRIGVVVGVILFLLFLQIRQWRQRLRKRNSA
jgi:hypothetical protein